MTFITLTLLPMLLTILSIMIPIAIADVLYHKCYYKVSYYSWESMWIATKAVIVILVFALVICISALLGTGLGYIADMWRDILN